MPSPQRKPIRDAKNPLLQWPNADGRPRIHIFDGPRPSYSFGPASARFHPERSTAGAALEDALASIDHQPAVIIYEGRGQ